MTLLALTLSATFWFHPVAGLTNWEANLSPTFVVELPVPKPAGVPAGALTLPHLVVASGPPLPRGWTKLDEPIVHSLIHHELQHTRQWEHLGPGFALAYLMMPSAFEDYLSHPEPTWAGTELNCPFLTITSTTVELLPCWRSS